MILSKKPTRDIAENNAHFPSEYSLSLYTSKKQTSMDSNLQKNN